MFKSARKLCSVLAVTGVMIAGVVTGALVPVNDVPVLEHVAPESASAVPVASATAALASHGTSWFPASSTFSNSSSRYFWMSHTGSVTLHARAVCRAGATAVTARVWNSARGAYYGGKAVIPCSGQWVKYTFWGVPPGHNYVKYSSWEYASVSASGYRS